MASSRALLPLPSAEQRGLKRSSDEDDDESSSPDSDNWSASKAERRTIRNRLSAQRSRDNKKARMVQLEGDNQRLKLENVELKRELDKLKQEMSRSKNVESSSIHCEDGLQEVPQTFTEPVDFVDNTLSNDWKVEDVGSNFNTNKPAELYSPQLEALMILILTFSMISTRYSRQVQALDSALMKQCPSAITSTGTVQIWVSSRLHESNLMVS